MRIFDFLTQYSSLVSVIAVALFTTYLAWREKRNARIKQLEKDKKESENTIILNQLDCLNNRLLDLEKDREYFQKIVDDLRYKK